MIRFRNKKTGKIYLLSGYGVDCTNIRDGLPIVIYVDPTDHPDDQKRQTKFIREVEEFNEKFETVEI